MSNNVLNLNEMLGRQEMIVKWNEAEYKLKSSNDLTPDEYVEVMTMGDTFTQAGQARPGKETTKEAQKAVDRMLEILCPELLQQDISFAGRVAVLTFWKEQEDEAKKNQAKDKKQP